MTNENNNKRSVDGPVWYRVRWRRGRQDECLARCLEGRTYRGRTSISADRREPASRRSFYREISLALCCTYPAPDIYAQTSPINK